MLLFFLASLAVTQAADLNPRLLAVILFGKLFPRRAFTPQEPALRILTSNYLFILPLFSQRYSIYGYCCLTLSLRTISV